MLTLVFVCQALLRSKRVVLHADSDWPTLCAASVAVVAVTACVLMSVAMQVACLHKCCRRSANEQDTYPLPEPISTHLHVKFMLFAGV